MDTETTLNYSRITELDYTMDKPVTDSGTFSDPTLNSTDLNSSSSPVRKRTDMNRLADPTLPHSFITGIPPESSTDIPETRRLLSWSEVNLNKFTSENMNSNFLVNFWSTVFLTKFIL
jgi:hypothetical protein